MRIAFYSVVLALLIGCSVQYRKIDNLNMFENNISSYKHRPIKYLILDSSYGLKEFYFKESENLFLDGIYLVFENNVTILVTIKDFEFETKYKKGKQWDINKCILENADDIFLDSTTPFIMPGYSQEVNVKYMSKDSLLINKIDTFDN